MKRRVLTVPPSDGGTSLADFVEKSLQLTPPVTSALIARGAVYRAGRRCKVATTSLTAGEVITVVLEETGLSAAAPKPSIAAPVVVFEDRSVLAVNKPAGMTAQPTASGAESSLLDWVSDYLRRPAGLVHRLDRETSGVTVFGKTPEATRSLAAAFREGTARKRYLAVCGRGLAPSGEIDLPLSPDPSRPGRYRATREANGVPALTRFVRLFEGSEFSLVALYPQTGRTHQLRAHLTALRVPILGDRRYGGAESAGGLPAARCLLHAGTLILPHPARQTPLILEAELPEDMRAFFSQAGQAIPQGPWEDNDPPTR